MGMGTDTGTGMGTGTTSLYFTHKVTISQFSRACSNNDIMVTSCHNGWYLFWYHVHFNKLVGLCAGVNIRRALGPMARIIACGPSKLTVGGPQGPQILRRQ